MHVYIPPGCGFYSATRWDFCVQKNGKAVILIADLTGQRNGVYYEAGYAMGKDKPLILCCKKEERDERHFDVAQINTILWENEEDLCDRLRKRIGVTINAQ